MRAPLVAVAVVAAGLAFPGVLPAAEPTAPDTTALAERYYVNGDVTQVITVSRLGRDVYLLLGKGWDGVGMLNGTSYWGVFRQSWGITGEGPRDTRGTHRGLLRPDGSFAVRGEYVSGLTGKFEVVWTVKAGETVPPVSSVGPSAPGHGFELPEAITKVPPVYPEAARQARIEGTVVLQAHVGEDGRVKDTRVVQSIPGLDGAAIAAVRQWVFKPATSDGKPMAVWVSVPVKFPPQ